MKPSLRHRIRSAWDAFKNPPWEPQRITGLSLVPPTPWEAEVEIQGQKFKIGSSQATVLIDGFSPEQQAENDRRMGIIR